MGGGRSIQLARVFGVRIGVDPTWFIVLFLVIWSLSGSFKDIYPGHDTKAFALATVSALLFFASVVLIKHEVNEQDPNKPLRFQFEAQWAGAME